jgi:bis(5'-nucleosyl)-tetraphosphatase (symmetrical)
MLARVTRRRILVGDVQGCRTELETLLEAVRFDPAADELHPVGDFVNRGPDSAGVLRLARTLGAGGVLGNHDLHLITSAAGGRPLRERDTFQDVLAADDRDELVAWPAARPFLLAFPDVYVVHAGLHPRWDAPERTLAGVDPRAPDADARFAVSVRWCDERGRRPENDDVEPPPPSRPWYEHYRPERHGDRTVVFGHWSVRGLVELSKVRGLDTGCVWGRELSAWIPEEDRLVQVPARRAYARY